MASAAFKKIMAGFEDALDHASGVPTAGRTTRVNVTEVDVAKLRAKLGLSQSEFAHGFGVPIGTVQGWEQRRRKPGGPARVLLTIVDRDPLRVFAMLWPKAKPKLKGRGKQVRLGTPGNDQGGDTSAAGGPPRQRAGRNP